MTRADFRTLVKEYTRFEGKPYPATNPDWDTCINDGLAMYSFLTCALWADNIAINTGTGWLTTGYPVYDLMDATFYLADALGYGRRVFWPKNVMVQDRPLRNLQDKIGPVTLDQMQHQVPYATTGVDKDHIKNWCFMPGYKIRIYPPPSAGFNGGGVKTGVIAGFYLHPALGNDAHTIYFADHHLHRSAAFCASVAMEPHAVGIGALAKMQAIHSVLGGEVANLTNQAQNAMMGELGYVLQPPMAMGGQQS